MSARTRSQVSRAGPGRGGLPRWRPMCSVTWAVPSSPEWPTDTATCSPVSCWYSTAGKRLAGRALRVARTYQDGAPGR